MLRISDPVDGLPSFAEENHEKTSRRQQQALSIVKGVEFPSYELLIDEDGLVELAEVVLSGGNGNILLDITSMPKRFFAFLLKRILRDERCENLLITYTGAGEGYTNERLSYDPLPPDGLPGFNDGSNDDEFESLVVSVGFEPHQLHSFVRQYLKGSARREIRVIVPFPPDGLRFRRNWSAMRELIEGQPTHVRRENIFCVAAWDVGAVMERLRVWGSGVEGLLFAAFGPKPHAVAMAAYLSVENLRGSIVYSQPKVYHPQYSLGAGETHVYVLKRAHVDRVGGN